MGSVQRSAAWLRKRKMLLVVPILIVPFFTMGFWALGGGKGMEKSVNKQRGLNLDVPGAKLKKNEPEDKLSFYELAAKDSVKLAEQLQRDAYYKHDKDEIFPSYSPQDIGKETASKYNQSLQASAHSFQRRPEEEILRKVALLQTQLSRPEQRTDREAPESVFSNHSQFSSEVDRLESMIQTMNSNDTTDPQMSQMSELLNRILDIQHPERVREKKEASLTNKAGIFSVSNQPREAAVSLLDTSIKNKEEQKFYSLDNASVNIDHNAISAAVHGTQSLVNGAVIKLRLLTDISIAGNLVPKESFVFGVCTLNGERLDVQVRSIRYHNSIYPVKLEVYDLDGLQGIYIPGAITRDIARQSAENSLQLMELNSSEPSLKAQATATGLQAVKNLISKKSRLIKVTVKAGYKILLKTKEGV